MRCSDTERQRGKNMRRDRSFMNKKDWTCLFVFNYRPFFFVVQALRQIEIDPVPRKTHAQTSIFFFFFVQLDFHFRAQTRSSHLPCPMVRFNLFPRTASKMLYVAW